MSPELEPELEPKLELELELELELVSFSCRRLFFPAGAALVSPTSCPVSLMVFVTRWCLSTHGV